MSKIPKTICINIIITDELSPLFFCLYTFIIYYYGLKSSGKKIDYESDNN